MTNDRDVLITGGGIAGPVAAMALKKAGWRPSVFEAFDHGADGVGAFLTLAVNGIDALGAIDMDGAGLGGFETPRMSIRLGGGQQLAEFAHGPRLASGAIGRTVSRAELYANLRNEAVRRGVTFAYGKRLESVRRTPEGKVVARFEDGSEATGDLLVGADGLHSRVRQLIDPRAPRARYLGLLNTGGYARGVQVPSPVGTFEMVFGKRCFFGYVRQPNDEVWWFANPNRAKEPSRAELAVLTPEAWRAELLDLASQDAPPVPDIIRATPKIIPPWATYDFPRVPRWRRERMLLIGDAAHAASPSSGQGASMAIEDAIVLALCLRDSPGIDAALETYEARRRGRVERVVAQGKRNGSGKTPGLLGRVTRDFFLKLIFGRMKDGANDSLRWLYEHHLAWEPVAG